MSGDAYAGLTFRQDFEDLGITYEVSSLTKSDLYDEFEPRLNASEVELLDLGKLQEQLLTLVLKPGGKTDYLPGDHDDWANAACGAVVMASGDSEPGMLTYVKQEMARIRAGTDFFSLLDGKKAEPMVRRRAPADVTTLYLRDGCAVRVPSDRIVEISATNARSLEASGRWSRVAFEEGVLH